jgi:outer membrane receptor protein involved in Fe transport
MKKYLPPFLLVPLLASAVLAGNTGKIAGKVVNDKNEPLPFAHLQLVGTTLGGTSDQDGKYYIINIPPGTYTLKGSFIGYSSTLISNVSVSADRTTLVDCQLNSEVLNLGSEVVVVAERPLVIKDRTSSAAKISYQEIDALPVQNLEDVLKLQAGIVVDVGGGIHIRGGRSDEVSYMVNGIAITDPYSGEVGLRVEYNTVQELTVVSGTFDAEYGQAQSGIINVVTKEGGDRYAGSITAYGGSYYTNAAEYLNIDKVRPSSYQDYQAQFSGPIPVLQSLSFFASGRYIKDDGYLYGQRIYNVGDSSDFSSPLAQDWRTHATGDGAIVPMNNSTNYSLQGSLTSQFTSQLKLTLLGSYNNHSFKLYDHNFKYDPDGDYQRFNNGSLFSLSLTHVLSQSTFYQIQGANVQSDYKYYTFENPVDPRYPPDNYTESKPYNFKSGGAKMDQLYRTSISRPVKFQFTSQLDNINHFQAGFDAQWYNLKYDWFLVVNNERTGFTPSVDPAIQGPYAREHYDVRPVQYSAYAQDKIELQDLIVNLGVRFDSFDSKYVVPEDFENPTDSPKKPASPKRQVSPRLGIAYPISDRGALHFSYGHFFQIPPFEYLYYNPGFEIVSGSLQSLIGNADLEPERTVSYEIGLQQQLTDYIVVEVTGFYKDIRNLLSTEIHRTNQQTLYARYFNKDYGNVRGITLTVLKKKLASIVGASLDYTFSVAEGNSSDPNSVFLDNQSTPPIESEVQLLPLNWDQTHTINATVNLGQSNWGVSLIGRYGTGLPYTPTPNGLRTTTFPQNSERKPTAFNVDLQAFYGFKVADLELNLMLDVFNLLDRRNELQVYSETGRAGYTIIPGRQDVPVVVSTLDDYLTRPDFFSAPRLIKLGVQVSFNQH